MAKTSKKSEPKPETAKVLMRRLRGMVQLQHFAGEDRFVVIIQTSPKQKLWMDWEKLVDVFGDFEAIVKAKKALKK